MVRLIDHLKSKIDASSSFCLAPYHSALAKLAEIDQIAAQGAQVRSRIRWVEEGESSSSYFFRLERKRSLDRRISALKNDDGSIVSSPDDLCRSFASFYSALFTAAPTDSTVQTALLNNLSSVLPPDMASLCEGYLTMKECIHTYIHTFIYFF